MKPLFSMVILSGVLCALAAACGDESCHEEGCETGGAAGTAGSGSGGTAGSGGTTGGSGGTSSNPSAGAGGDDQ